MFFVQPIQLLSGARHNSVNFGDYVSGCVRLEKKVDGFTGRSYCILLLTLCDIAESLVRALSPAAAGRLKNL